MKKKKEIEVEKILVKMRCVLEGEEWLSVERTASLII
jgi:hypothetical protein